MPPEQMHADEHESLTGFVANSPRTEDIHLPENMESAREQAQEAFTITERLGSLIPEQDARQTRFESELFHAHEAHREALTRTRIGHDPVTDEKFPIEYTAGNKLTVEHVPGKTMLVIEKSEHVLAKQADEQHMNYTEDVYAMENKEVLKREWLAYVIDRALGLGMVPTTILRDGKEGLASWQEWKENKIASIEVKWKAIPHDNEEFQRLALTQIAVFNVDAHKGNVLIASEDEHCVPTKMWQIDNGFSQVLKSPEVRAFAWKQLVGEPIQENLLERFDWFLKNQKVQEVVHDGFCATFGEEHAQDYWDAFMQRITILTDGGFFPKLADIAGKQHDRFSKARTYIKSPIEKAA